MGQCKTQTAELWDVAKIEVTVRRLSRLVRWLKFVWIYFFPMKSMMGVLEQNSEESRYLSIKINRENFSLDWEWKFPELQLKTTSMEKLWLEAWENVIL